jgi:hypothetical protein
MKKDFLGFLLCFLFFVIVIEGLAPCKQGHTVDICGFDTADYPALGLTGVPPLCNAECNISVFDRCGVCNGLAPIYQTLLQPIGQPTVNSLSKYGSSVANWNGSIAVAQSLAADVPPIVPAPVVTFVFNHTSLTWDEYHLPVVTPAQDNTVTGGILAGRGYGLSMSENFLVVGSPDSTERILQLWGRTVTPPWSWIWTAYSPCPGSYFGLSVAIDERIPHAPGDGIFGTVVTGDPNARYTGRVWVYLTYSFEYLQELWYGTGTEGPTFNSCYGKTVAADSGYLAVGAPSLDYAGQSKAGNVFVYLWDPYLGEQGEYDNVTFITIPPPVPTQNGGFGESVSVWSNYVLIGDNQHGMYLYRIIGLSAVLVSFDLPTGFNQDSRFGYAGSIWEDLIVAGDENFIPDWSSRGSAFIWQTNPLLTASYRLMWHLTDDTNNVLQTRYGAAVDTRGGCWMAIGAPGYTSPGGVYAVNLCEFDCYGCDDQLNSCIVDDYCGVCDGDNTTCMDCLGVIGGNATLDVCNVCQGTNNSCIAITSPTTFSISCNHTLVINISHATQNLYGLVKLVNITVYPTKGTLTFTPPGSSVLTYQGTVYQHGTDHFSVMVSLKISPTKTLYATYSVTVNIANNCVDCLGIVGGTHLPIDSCHNCNGTFICDCLLEPYGPAVIDPCGVCDGDSSTCLDIIVPPPIPLNCTTQIIQELHVVPNVFAVKWSITQQPPPGQGSVIINPNLGVFTYTNPGISGYVVFEVTVKMTVFPFLIGKENITLDILNCTDCSGSQNGLQLVDLCGVCGGNSRSCVDCAGIPYGPFITGPCLDCFLPNVTIPSTSCNGCDGVPFSGLTIKCGICGGDGTNCIGSKRVPVIPMVAVILASFIMGAIGWYSWIAIKKLENMKQPPPITPKRAGLPPPRRETLARLPTLDTRAMTPRTNVNAFNDLNSQAIQNTRGGSQVYNRFRGIFSSST